MAYTDVWDVTQPLDTQAANQGAADFRATKLDVMQRIASFGAGLIANRPTPESTSASANWTGVMYWATDTQQCFMWSGTAWVNISASLPPTSAPFYSDLTVLSYTGPLSELMDYDGNSISIPIGILSVGSIINVATRFEVTYLGTPSTASLDVALIMGGGIAGFINYPDATNNYVMEGNYVIATNTSMIGIFTGTPNGVAPIIIPTNATITDITASAFVIQDGIFHGHVAGSSHVSVVFDYLSVTVN
jgi:hypothetical protein